jgi:hypothetical protein
MAVDTRSGAEPHDATTVRAEVLEGLETFREEIKEIVCYRIKQNRYQDILEYLDSAARQMELALRVPAEGSNGVELGGNDFDYQHALLASSKKLLMNARTLLRHVRELISERTRLP